MMISNAVFRPENSFSLSPTELIHSCQQNVNGSWQETTFSEYSLFQPTQIHDVVIPQLLARYVAISELLSIKCALNPSARFPVYVLHINLSYLSRHVIENEIVLRLKTSVSTDFVYAVPTEQIKYQDKTVDQLCKCRAEIRMRYAMAWSMVYPHYSTESESMFARLHIPHTIPVTLAS